MKEKGCLYLNVKVLPRSPKQEVVRLDSGEYRVRVQAAPSKGEANKELIKVIAAHFSIPASRVEIVKGHKSRNKVVAVPKVP
ncbi:MAG: DUF167 domain-containing protein [Candidatus Aminicenantes bacterium]|nr:DUF167 domain-containing protein [Candidatus Aminicenantes bacterium]